ncbi:MAG TPA: hypothetical protein VK586_00410 [Streptosporangiaceae bacterium]|nr:hypothetical protein [Streptosporangiaceae bacterium]
MTRSPARTRYSCATGTAAEATGPGEVAVSTVPPGWAGVPRPASTAATRSGPGA